MAVNVYRSTDTNAPTLSGVAGSLLDVLTACLVNGYGSAFASGTVTSDGTNVSDGDTVTIGSKTYTFKTTLVVGVANQVLIGASAAASLSNLQAAVNLTGTSGTTYTAVTLGNADVWGSAVTSTVLTARARRGGSTGNSLALAASSAHLSVSGATLTGGSGSNSTAGAGWTAPYSGNPGQAVFRGGSGVQHYYHLDDALPHATAVGKEAQFRGSDTASGFQAGVTNYFPTTTQVALGSGLVMRKSASIDTAARAWVVIADDRTVYVFCSSGDVAGLYNAAMFGELYSIMSTTDLYRSTVIGRATANAAAALTTEVICVQLVQGNSSNPGHYTLKAYTGTSTAINGGKFGDVGRGCNNTNLATMGTTGGLPAPNGPDGKIHISPVHALDTINVSLLNHVRGRYRGMYHVCHTINSFADRDTIVGSGPYAGRTFLVILNLGGLTSSAGMLAFDITGPWETN